MHRPRLHPRPITSASLEVDQAAVYFLNPQVIPMWCKGCKLGLLSGSQSESPGGLVKPSIPGLPAWSF